MPVLEANELAADANELASYWFLAEARFVDLILGILHESLSVGADDQGFEPHSSHRFEQWLDPVGFFELAFFGVERNDVIEVYLLALAGLYREALVEVGDEEQAGLLRSRPKRHGRFIVANDYMRTRKWN